MKLCDSTKETNVFQYVVMTGALKLVGGQGKIHPFTAPFKVGGKKSYIVAIVIVVVRSVGSLEDAVKWCNRLKKSRRAS